MSIDYSSLLVIWLHPWDSYIIDFEKLQAKKPLRMRELKTLDMRIIFFSIVMFTL